MKAARMLRMARRRAGLSQRELSRRTGVPQPSISRIERGLVSPAVDTLGRLLDACGMELEALEELGRGVDRTQITELLALTPAERVRHAVHAARALERLLGPRWRAG